MKGSPMANHTRKPLLSVQKGFPVVVVPRQPKSTTSLPLSGPTLKHFKAKPQRNIPLIPLQTPRIVMSQKPSATSTARSKSFKGKVASLVKQKYFNHSRIPLRLASSSPSLLDILMKSQQKSYENSYCHQKASLEQLKQTISCSGISLKTKTGKPKATSSKLLKTSIAPKGMFRIFSKQELHIKPVYREDSSDMLSAWGGTIEPKKNAT